MIANTISVILMWMLANIFFGLYLGFAFFKMKPGLGNIIYYVLALATLFWLVRYIIRKWSRFAES